MTGRCPNCLSTQYQPDPSNGGAGRNVCMSCGHRAAVVEFHKPDYAYRTGQRITRTTRDEVTIKVTMLMPALRTDTPPAPIRQYKDD